MFSLNTMLFAEMLVHLQKDVSKRDNQLNALMMYLIILIQHLEKNINNIKLKAVANMELQNIWKH